MQRADVTLSVCPAIIADMALNWRIHLSVTGTQADRQAGRRVSVEGSCFERRRTLRHLGIGSKWLARGQHWSDRRDRRTLIKAAVIYHSTCIAFTSVLSLSRAHVKSLTMSLNVSTLCDTFKPVTLFTQPRLPLITRYQLIGTVHITRRYVRLQCERPRWFQWIRLRDGSMGDKGATLPSPVRGFPLLAPKQNSLLSVTGHQEWKFIDYIMSLDNVLRQKLSGRRDMVNVWRKTPTTMLYLSG